MKLPFSQLGFLTDVDVGLTLKRVEYLGKEALVALNFDTAIEPALRKRVGFTRVS